MRAAFGLDDEAAVVLAPDRPRADTLVQVGAGSVGGGGESGEVATRVDEPAPWHDERAVVRVGADLLVQAFARDDRGLDAHRGETLALVLETAHV